MLELKLNGIITIVALFSISQLQTTNAEIKSFNQSYEHPQKRIYYNKYGFNEGNFVYLVCDTSSTKSENVCTLVQHHLPNNNVTRSCDFTHPKNVAIDGSITVVPLGRDNAVVFWGDWDKGIGYGLLNIMTIELNDCKMKTLQLDDPYILNFLGLTYYHPIVTFDDSFDIFLEYPRPPRSWIENQRGWRISLDDKPQPIFANIKNGREEGLVWFITSVSPKSPDKGYVYTTTNERNAILYYLRLIKPDGTKKLLPYGRMRHFVITTGYEVITWCVKDDVPSTVRCTQFDENGNEKFSMIVNHDATTVYMMSAVHNSRLGGFLLMVTSLEIDEQQPEYNVPPTSYHVVRIDGEGRQVGSVELKGFIEAHYNSQSFSIWENGDEYCAALVGTSLNYFIEKRSPDRLTAVVKCFTERDFLL